MNALELQIKSNVARVLLILVSNVGGLLFRTVYPFNQKKEFANHRPRRKVNLAVCFLMCCRTYKNVASGTTEPAPR